MADKQEDKKDKGKSGKGARERTAGAVAGRNDAWKYLALLAIIIAIVAVVIATLNQGPQGPPGPQGLKGEPGQAALAPAPATQATTPSVTPRTTQYVTGAEVRALLQMTFPGATPTISQSSYRLYPVQQFAAFTQQEYTSGNYSRFVIRTFEPQYNRIRTDWDGCGAANQLISNAIVKLPGIPIGTSKLSDNSRVCVIAVFRNNAGQLEVLSFAPLDGKGLENDSSMQVVQIR